MKRVKNYTICKESVEKMLMARRFNPCLEITFTDKNGRHAHRISAGYEDEIHVYRENGYTFVLCKNSRIGYIGLEVFSGRDQFGNFFLQPYQIAYVLGKYNLAPFTIIRRLKEYVAL